MVNFHFYYFNDSSFWSPVVYNSRQKCSRITVICMMWPITANLVDLALKISVGVS